MYATIETKLISHGTPTQAEGGPSASSNNVQVAQNNQETKSKVTAMSHLMEKIQGEAPGFSSRFLPGFCYHITQV